MKTNSPKNFSIMSNAEQKQLFAGSVSLPMKRDYLDKDYCMEVGKSLVNSGKVTGMTYMDIAIEIFAHAKAYYAADAVKALNLDGINYLLEHADPIDIEDGGDTEARKYIYTVIWGTFVDNM